VCPPPFCLSVKLNSGDYMAEGRLTIDEALERVRWLLELGMVISRRYRVGLQSSLLPSCIVSQNGLSGPSLWALTLDSDSFDKKTMSKAPVMREKYLDP
jgi:hypothetical protein